jgi:hypothetical protein
VEHNEYYVQCITGDQYHVFVAIPGTKLEQKCKERAAQGVLDAFILSTDECPECIVARQQRESRNADMCASTECMFMSFDKADDPCRDGCQAYEPIQDSPYNDQIRGLPIIAG